MLKPQGVPVLEVVVPLALECRAGLAAVLEALALALALTQLILPSPRALPESAATNLQDSVPPDGTVRGSLQTPSHSAHLGTSGSLPTGPGLAGETRSPIWGQRRECCPGVDGQGLRGVPTLQGSEVPTG